MTERETIPADKLKELYMFYNRLIGNPDELQMMKSLIKRYDEIVENNKIAELGNG